VQSIVVDVTPMEAQGQHGKSMAMDDAKALARRF
jgi:hypothetical protein